jgi:hypothetical protein
VQDIRRRLLRVDIQELETTPDLPDDRVGRVGLRDAAPHSHEVDDREKRYGCPIRQTSPLEIRDPLASQNPAEFEEEA